jgi:colanic acid/amylovoran biosynthesis glycosyltransferase
MPKAWEGEGGASPALTRLPAGQTRGFATLSRNAGEGLPGARETVLIYRHRLAPASEVGFLGRFYAAFERLTPVWVGCHLDAGAQALTDTPLRLGRAGPIGAVERSLFRHFGVVPSTPDLRGLRPRLIHAHFGRGGALALPIARALGVPLVVTFHGADAAKESHYRPRLVPRVYARRLAMLQREAALFICVSEFVRETLLARGFPAEKLEVIHQGVESNASPAPSAVEGERYILFVGRFVEKKGAADLIKAMRLLADRGCDIRLVLVGNGPLAGSLRAQASGLDGVTFADWLPNVEVRRLMRGAAAVCVPSVTARDGDSEGLPTVIFEAMAEGAAVVATRHAGIPEAVEHGRTGLLVPPGDAPALADALERLWATPELRAEFGAAARRVAFERFSAVGQSRRLERALLRVAGLA